jgi:hypothetical protein
LRSIEQEVKSIKLRAKRYDHRAVKHKSNKPTIRTKWSRLSQCVNHHDTARVGKRLRRKAADALTTTQAAESPNQLKRKKIIPHAEEMRRAPMLNKRK